MAEPSAKRSVRRGVAVLLLPVSGATTLPAFVEAALPGVSSVVGVVLFVAAVAYLVGSVSRQVAAAADTPL
ncbi:hypothetical protein PM076_08600 [Halorubrum ezzemoulense]|jgi:hypothetical protein|uniref:Uncharacterized protein n=2 Tax=Halorubrum ezzemoulense TaxID=337243 RepID=A0A256JW09_HALEZ|nr:MULTISPECIES: hypothetical protein [Halorubrum]MDB2223219.1 hypothetical protein [Halorubrum ezzemoulense]MDB2237815.1 hypothetical protein [Halorubrum ezzemoulense]MDB2240591.1 hypothetical protein [Halorubrum ezzemoulense]MDB2243531.1 hypothetical protein [Halorubrum ezzemoulense]MDB2248691.1 hypothetical protein [Halorubrum ezzemoulense]